MDLPQNQLMTMSLRSMLIAKRRILADGTGDSNKDKKIVSAHQEFSSNGRRISLV